MFDCLSNQIDRRGRTTGAEVSCSTLFWLDLGFQALFTHLPVRHVMLVGGHGSACYSRNGCSVIASVYGPIEAQKRSELSEAATVDVVVRSADGLSGIQYRAPH